MRYFPQSFRGSQSSNSKYPPHGFTSDGVDGLTTMQYEDGTNMAYDFDWFNLLWQKRIRLALRQGQVPSIQFNFPVLVNFTLFNLIGESADELRFTEFDNKQMEYETQKFDIESGELIAWEKIPSISNGDMVNIYYDNPAATDEQNPAAVWDSNYNAVYHMQNNGNDSTSNAQNLTNFGSALTPVSGKIGGAQEYLGTVNDYSIRNPFSGWPTTEMTIEIWIKTTDTNSSGIISYAVGSGSLANHFLFDTPSNLRIVIDDTAISSGVSIADGSFHHIVVKWRSADGLLILYVDSIVVLTTTLKQGFTFTDGGSLVLGQDQDTVGGGFEPETSLDAILDDFRISNNFRSADYITTSFNNQNDPSSFFGTGEDENVPLTQAIPMGYET